MLNESACYRLEESLPTENENDIHALVEQNLYLVGLIAQSYRLRAKSAGMTLDDIIQEGSIGLFHAAEKFDQKRKFSTYAIRWIRFAIIGAIFKNNGIVKVTAGSHGRNRSCFSALGKLRQKLEREPIPEEMAGEMDISPEEAEVLIMNMRATRTVPLDHPYPSEAGLTLAEIIADDAQPGADELCCKAEKAEKISGIVNSLKTRQCEVIRLRFGLDSSCDMTLQEVGDELGLSRERIRQIEAKALENLSKRLRNADLTI